MVDFDDKDLAIITIGAIAISAVIVFAIKGTIDAATVVTHCVTAIAGIATGKALERARINGNGNGGNANGANDPDRKS